VLFTNVSEKNLCNSLVKTNLKYCVILYNSIRVSIHKNTLLVLFRTSVLPTDVSDTKHIRAVPGDSKTI